MSLLVALMLSQAATEAVSVPQEAEITVIARKLKSWRGDWLIRKGKVTCKIRKSTGDKEIDAIACTAMVTCLEPHLAEHQAIWGSKDDRKTKNARWAKVLNSAAPCMEQANRDGIAALADRRAGS